MKQILYGVLCALSALAAVSCAGGAEYRKASGAGWGTLYNITYRADRDLSDSVVAVMRRVELSVSAFEPSSTVSRVNRGEASEVDSMFASVFECSRLVSRLSGGAFDPTVAPLVNIWGFGYRDGEEEPPAQRLVEEELAKVGIDRCRLEGLRLYRRHPATEFDFSAVAKGFGVDCVAAMLRRNGVEDYMVEIGGEVAVAGRNPRGQAWRIAVEEPVSGTRGGAVSVVGLTDCALATSGNYRNFRELPSDSVIGHTIDPRTGYPARTTVASATVKAPTCMLADALATACMVIPAEQGLALADSLDGVSIMLVVPDGGQWRVLKNGVWD